MNDTFANLVDGSGAVSANMAKIDDKDADVAVTVSDTIGTASAQNVTDLNALLGATTGTVTATINGSAANLASLTGTSTDTGTSTLTITVNDVATAARGAAIADATDATTVDFSAAGVNDTFANLVDGSGAVSANMAKIDDKDADVAVTVSDTIGTASAQNVTDLNALLGATTGTVTATINGDYAELSSITTTATDAGTSTLTITVNDAVTAAQGNTALGLTDGTVIYGGGVSDTFANLVDGSGAVSTNMGNIDNADADVAVTVSDTIGTASAQNVTDLNALLGATTGTVTATINGSAANLASLTGTSGDDGTSTLTITVNDVATAARGAAIADATDATTVDFSAAGVNDTFANLVDGSGAVSANMAKIDDKDADVAVTVSDTIGTASAQNVTDLNALLGATTGTVTATINGSAANLASLTGTSTDTGTSTLTITVNDVATAARGAAIADATDATTVDFSAAGVNDTFANLVDGSGAVSANMAKIDDKDADVAVTVSDTIGTASAQNVTDLNALLGATTGTVTATINGDYAELSSITTTATDAGTSTLTITVNDAVTAAQGNTALGLTDGTVIYGGGVSDTFANLVDGSGAVSTNMGNIDNADADVAVTVSDTIGTASAQNVTDLNALLGATTGTVTATINGSAANLASLTGTSGDDGTSTLTITVNDAATAARGAAIADATDATTVDFSAAGVNDTFANLVDGSGAVSANMAKIDDKDADVAVTVSDTIGTASAQNVTDLNALLGATTGTVTATINGSAANLASLTGTSTDTGTSTLTITVNDAATAARGAAIADATDATTVDFSAAGVNDTFANLVDGSGAVSANMAKIDDKDADVAVTVSDTIGTASAQNVTDLNALLGATTGTVTATINGSAANLASLTGTSTDTGTSTLTITVNDVATAARGAAIADATDATTVDFSAAGVNDTFANLVDGSGAVSANMAKIDDKDADVAVTVSDTIGTASAQNVTDLNALLGATTGTVTATINGDYAELSSITTTATDAGTSTLTITVNDAVTAAQGNTALGLTDGTVIYGGGVSDTFANLVDGSGAVSTNMGNIDNADADVAVTVSDTIGTASAQNVTDLNALLGATTGTVTATINGSAANLASLTGTSGDDGTSTLTITVNDAATAARGAAIADATDATTVDFSAAGVNDTFANLVDGSGAVSANMAKIDDKDADVAVTVSDTIGTASAQNVTDLNALLGATTGTVTATINGSAANLASLTGTSTDTGTSTLTITVNDVATAARGAAIADATDATTVDFSAAGVNDTFANLVDGSGAVSANMAKIDDKDADVAVTVSDTIGTASAQNVTDLNALLGATTGTVTATINGDYAELSSITTTATDAGTSTLTITVNDAVTAAQGNTALGLTDGTVIYGGGVSDTFANLVDGSGAVSTNMGNIDNADADVAVTVSDTIGTASAQNVTDLNALLGATTGTVTATINGSAANLASLTGTSGDDGTSTLTITVNDVATAARGAAIADATDATTVDFSAAGVNDTFANLVDGSGAVSANMAKIDDKDADVAVTVSDTIGTASAQNVTDLNALLGATTGTVTATINGSAANLASLTATSSDDGTSTLTITVNDVATAARGAAIADATDATTVDFSAAGVNDTFANLVDGSGAVSANMAKIDDKDADVAVTVSDTIGTASAQNVTDLNALLGATTGTVTATINGSAANLASLTGTSTDTGTSTLTITVNDAATARAVRRLRMRRTQRQLTSRRLV